MFGTFIHKTYSILAVHAVIYLYTYLTVSNLSLADYNKYDISSTNFFDVKIDKITIKTK